MSQKRTISGPRSRSPLLTPYRIHCRYVHIEVCDTSCFRSDSNPRKRTQGGSAFPITPPAHSSSYIQNAFFVTGRRKAQKRPTPYKQQLLVSYRCISTFFQNTVLCGVQMRYGGKHRGVLFDMINRTNNSYSRKWAFLVKAQIE